MSIVIPDRWTIDEARLRNLDAIGARDLLVECFMTAQRSVFAHTKQSMGLSTDERNLERSVLGAVRVAFKRSDGDFDNPTKSSLHSAVDALAHTAVSWGTPADVVEHHKELMFGLISRLKD